MDFETYINNISFLFFQPEDPITARYKTIERGLKRIQFSLEFINTRLPQTDTEIVHGIKKLCFIPKLSTFAIGLKINKAVSLMPDEEMYLNIGVWNGFTYFSGLINNRKKWCTGVDNFSEEYFSELEPPRDQFFNRFQVLRGSRHSFFETNYREYFASREKDERKIGVFYYDGAHDYTSQYQALVLAEPFLSPTAVIFIDDINWDDPERATLQFLRDSPNRYSIIYHRKTAGNEHPTLWNGLMIISRKSGS